MPATGLAARCTACGTVFRVVPDQLRVSEGWVRCGRCAEVFNASENLVDIETGAPRRAPDDWPQPGRPEVPQPPAPGVEGVGDAPVQSTPHVATRDPADESAEAHSTSFTPPAPEKSIATPDTGSALTASADGESNPAATVPAASAPKATAADTTPRFLRQAEQAQRWRQPRVRAALGLLALLGALGLAAQVVHTWRDRVAAHFPATRPLLEQLCKGIGCTVPAVREIQSLTVESSGLVRVERSSIYKLQAVLRNRASIDLALPALELSLTDAQGRLTVRKVLQADALGAAGSTLGAGQNLSLQATLQVLAQAAPTEGAAAPPADPQAPVPAIAGYTIELFYP